MDDSQIVGGVYSNTQIKQAIAQGHIVFHPYNEKHIAGSRSLSGEDLV
jgi:hypothetical protein